MVLNCDDTRQKKARGMRFKKPLSKSMNWQQINEDIFEMQSACADVKWLAGDDEDLLDLFDGNEETAFEFKMAFSDLAAECYQFERDLEEVRRYDFMSTDQDDESGEASIFDAFFPAIDTSGGLYGYDEFEGDYYGLDLFERDAAQRSARKKILRLTKDQLCDLAGTAFRIARNYWGLVYRYDCLKVEIDIIRGQNEGLLKIVKGIEKAYDEWDEESQGGKLKWGNAEEALMTLDRMLAELPDRFWIE